ncbi:MAG: PRC-barrel domain-containing protein [Gammaproteobacteria bacterium]|nr:PRC-barrel domain-containing protein [Gammaproteobacteria bacterium]
MAELVRLSAALARAVVDRQGRPVGRLREVLFDGANGRIAYACIELEQRNRRCYEAIVPWSTLSAEPGERWRLSVLRPAVERLAQPAGEAKNAGR